MGRHRQDLRNFLFIPLISDLVCHEARLFDEFLSLKTIPVEEKRITDQDAKREEKGPAKKAKPTAATSGGSSSCTMENGEPTWTLGSGMKFVKVREFKGKTYIDIREYYVDKSTM